MKLERKVCPICGQEFIKIKEHYNLHKDEVEFNDFMAAVEGIERPICEHCGKPKVWIQKNRWRCVDPECMRTRDKNKYRPEKECPVCGATYKRMRDHWRQSHKEEFPDYEDFIVYAFLGPDVERPTCPYCGSKMHWCFAHGGYWACDNQQCRQENHTRRLVETSRERQSGFFKPGVASKAGKIGGARMKELGIGIFDSTRAEEEKWGFRDPKIHQKTIDAQRENQTGRFNPDFYKNHKETIDTALAKGRETQRENKLGIYSLENKLKMIQARYGNVEHAYFYLLLLEDVETGIYYTKPGYTCHLLPRIKTFESDWNGFKITKALYTEGTGFEMLDLEQSVHFKFEYAREDPNQGRSEEWKWLESYSEYKRGVVYDRIVEYVSSCGKELKRLELEEVS